jgi:hypothetical protein
VTGDIPILVVGTLIGIVTSSLFVMFLLVGFSLILGFPKLRKSGGKTLIVRGLDEAIGGTNEFLPPSAPRGPADQLHTPELEEAKRRKAAAHAT